MQTKMIHIDDVDKVRIARYGANKIFVIHYDDRKIMDDKELIELFDRAWSNGLNIRIQRAEIIQPEEVERRLLDRYHTYINHEQEHRSFHYSKTEFIVQLEKFSSKEYRLTQLWRVASSDSHPKTLFINFDSIEEKEQFDELANKLGFDAEKLGIILIRNFVNLHPNIFNNTD